MQPEQIIDVVNIVRQVADGLRPLAQERKVAIKIDAQVEPLNVRGDHDELVRCVENLIENALKYGGTGKKGRCRHHPGRRTHRADFPCGITARASPRNICRG